MKYRIKEVDGLYTPQWKLWFFWICLSEPVHRVEWAEHYIKQHRADCRQLSSADAIYHEYKE